MTDIDPSGALAALGVTGITNVEHVLGGWDTLLWRVSCDSGTCALRLFSEGRIPDAKHEVRIMRFAARAGLQVPAVHAEGMWENRAALLLGWCDGRTLMQEVRKRPWSVRGLGYLFGQRQAEMHRMAFERGDDAHLDWMTRFGPIDNELRVRLMDAQSMTDRILHFDYHPLNVMISDGRIGCILDWTNAMPGEPRADVARTWSILRLWPLTPGRPEPVTEATRRLLAAGWLRGYQDTAGPLQDMDVFKTWAGTAMVHDMRRKVDQPENWIEQRHVDTIQRRVIELRERAGLSRGGNR